MYRTMDQVGMGGSRGTKKASTVTENANPGDLVKGRKQIQELTQPWGHWNARGIPRTSDQGLTEWA